eukprot:jgi/Galph1/4832/GphlegSOOS_G3464.1
MDSHIHQVATASLQETVDLANEKEEGNWNFLKEKNNVRICKKKTGSLHTFRGTGIISYDLEEILPVATLVDRYDFIELVANFFNIFFETSRPTWDPLCKDGKFLREIDDTVSLVWWSFHGVLIISDRDFCLALNVKRISEDGSVCITTRSVEDPSCPLYPNYVRGYANLAGIVLKPCEGTNGTKVTYIGNVDPKGYLPHWAVNIGGEKGAMCIHYLQDYLDNHKVKQHV